jgi:hypothetical protein
MRGDEIGFVTDARRRFDVCLVAGLERQGARQLEGRARRSAQLGVVDAQHVVLVVGHREVSCIESDRARCITRPFERDHISVLGSDGRQRGASHRRSTGLRPELMA